MAMGKTTILLKWIRNALSAEPATRQEGLAILDEYITRGVLPGGMWTASDGSTEFVWGIFDRAPFATDEERMDYLRSRTPEGLPVRTLDFCGR